MDIQTAKRISELYHNVKMYTQKLEEILTYGRDETKRLRICMYELPEEVRNLVYDMAVSEAREKLRKYEEELKAIKIAE